VQVPLSCDQEALLGGLDLDATLGQGRRVVRPGALARADGGILLVDALNMLTDGSDICILSALDEGEVKLERDGISMRAPSDFRLVSGYDPAEGKPRTHLLDRIGLVLALPLLAGAKARSAVVRGHLGAPDPDWADDLDLMRNLVNSARSSLPDIQMADMFRQQLIETALSLGVEGHRVDLFAVLAAQASAALALRDQVEAEDVALAIRLVVMPRATRLPDAAAQAQPQPQSEPPESPPENADSNEDALPSEDNLEMTDDVLDAEAMALPFDLAALPFVKSRTGKSGSRGSTSGTRGRHIASMPGRLQGQKIDVIATLRAAAPWQKFRPSGKSKIAIRAEDIRIRRYKSKAGALFIFAVDASGSMALNRMREAKGAVHALLEQAYVNRDRVALISFRGQSADLLLPPTGSVELLRRAVDRIPTGGGTPLAATLLLSGQIAEQAKRGGFQNIILVLLTDGRANIGLRVDRAEVDEELRACAHATAASGLKSMLIDTQRSFLDHSAGENLAAWLGGTYLYLPNAKGNAIAAAARRAA
jgi:magnesium chelatase subunit D